jgi:hypothetical protein
MFTSQLFLGFPVDHLYARKLENANPSMVKEYIHSQGEYLCKITHNEMCFLGKKIGDEVALSKLELLEENIYSLLKKLVPDFPYDETPLYLISLLDDVS